MIGSLVKKFLLKKSNNEQEESNKKNLAIALREKSQEFSNGIGEKINLVKTEFSSMKEKYDNLLETNYNLGLRHIENGNLTEAIFRFRFIKKFWPTHYDSYYQLSYCLVLNRKSGEAKKILEELILKDPHHQQGKELLDLINSDLYSDQNFTAQDS